MGSEGVRKPGTPDWRNKAMRFGGEREKFQVQSPYSIVLPERRTLRADRGLPTIE